MRDRHRRILVLGAAMFGSTVAATLLLVSVVETEKGDLPLREVSAIQLDGGGARFDYADIDPDTRRLVAAHMGTNEVVAIDLHRRSVVWTTGDLADVHGVIAVPQLHRVFATATGTDELVALDARDGREVGRADTGDYPDGLAYDPTTGTVWTTNEHDGTETVVDAGTFRVRGTVELGKEVGNVTRDPRSGAMVVAVQSEEELAFIDPESLDVTRRIPTPGCETPHGLRIDPNRPIAYVGCEGNARLARIDLESGKVVDTIATGETPDVLSYDSETHKLWVGAESGWLTIADVSGSGLSIVASGHYAQGAHVVQVDQATHHVYVPVPGHPAEVRELALKP